MDAYAIVLYFDGESSEKLERLIREVANISGNNYMLDVKIPPHISIGAFLSGDAVALTEKTEVFAGKVKSFVVKFDGIRAFKPRVLFASPIMDEHLERLNRELYDILIEDFGPADNEYYTPEKWVPHCALAIPTGR